MENRFLGNGTLNPPSRLGCAEPKAKPSLTAKPAPAMAAAQSGSEAQRVSRKVSPGGMEFINDWETRMPSNRSAEAPGLPSWIAKVADIQQVINESVRVDLNQNQNDALVSFVRNVGADSFRRSTLLRLLNKGQYTLVPVELTKWIKARRDGKVVEAPALVKRRAAESELFLRREIAAGQSLNITAGRTRAYASAQSSTIPLDPGTGGRSIGSSVLRMGDIIVATTDQTVSSLIRWATGSQVSHAMLYIGGDQVVEAISSGVLLKSLAAAVADSNVAVAFRHPTMTPTQALMARDFAGKQLGKPYNYWGIVKQGGFQLDRETFCSGLTGTALDACVRLVGNVNLGKGNDDSFFCSQLVVAAYQSAGVPLTTTPPIWSSPGDLAQLGLSKRLGYIGHLKAPPLTP